MKLCPSLNARLMVAIGSDRPEMLPSESEVREMVDTQSPDVDHLRGLLAGWAWLAVQMVRESMDLRRTVSQLRRTVDEYLPPMRACPGCGDDTPGGRTCSDCEAESREDHHVAPEPPEDPPWCSICGGYHGEDAGCAVVEVERGAS